MGKSFFKRFRKSFRNKFKKKTEEKPTYVLNFNVDGNENILNMTLCGDCLGIEKNASFTTDMLESAISRKNISICKECNPVQKEKIVELESKSFVQPVILDDEQKRRLSVSRRYPKTETKESKDHQLGKVFYPIDDEPIHNLTMGLSTFETRCSRLTSRTDLIPELDSPLQMEVLDTVPKQVAQSMKVQKSAESTPLPDPVPAHEETQVKQMAEDTSSTETNPVTSSCDISSGYPILSIDIGADLTCSDFTLTSHEASQGPELCGSAQLRNKNNCNEMVLFNDVHKQCKGLEQDKTEETSLITFDVAVPSCHSDLSTCGSQRADMTGLIILTERYFVYRQWLFCVSVCCVAFVRSTGHLFYAGCVKKIVSKVDGDQTTRASSCDEDAMVLNPCNRSSEEVLLFFRRRNCITAVCELDEHELSLTERRSMESFSVLHRFFCVFYSAVVMSSNCWYSAWCIATALSKLITECTIDEVSAKDEHLWIESLSEATKNDFNDEEHDGRDQSIVDSCYFSAISSIEEHDYRICKLSETCCKHDLEGGCVLEDSACRSVTGANLESQVIIGATQIGYIKGKTTRHYKTAKEVHDNLIKVEIDHDKIEIIEKTLLESDTEVIDNITLGTTYTAETLLDTEKPHNDTEDREITGNVADNDFIGEISASSEHDKEELCKGNTCSVEEKCENMGQGESIDSASLKDMATSKDKMTNMTSVVIPINFLIAVDTNKYKDQSSDTSFLTEENKNENKDLYVGLEDDYCVKPLRQQASLEGNHNRERNKSLVKKEKDSITFLENERQEQFDLAVPQNLGESIAKVKPKKNEKRTCNYFCKFCHRSKNKPNPKCSFQNHHKTSSILMKEEANRTEFENTNIRNEIASIGSEGTDRSREYDSGVFSAFASVVSSYTSSYDSLKRSLKAGHCTDREKKQVHGKIKSTNGGCTKECKPVDTERKMRTQEKQLRDRLRWITSSWRYFTPESFNPYLYPGLQSYFQRIQDGEQLGIQERNSYEWIRFQSFDHYRGNGSGIVLARNGFYHNREGGPTSTRCYACDATYSEWEYFDDVEARHNPGCPHVHGGESSNIPIQAETDHDMQASAHRPDLTPAVDESREVNIAVVTERNTENEDEAKPAKDTAPTGGRSEPSPVDSLSNSMQQARINEQPYQPSQDRENEQYMSSYVVHRVDDSDLHVTSQDRYTSSPAAHSDQDTHAQSNRESRWSLPNWTPESTRQNRFGAGIQAGTAPPLGQPSSQPHLAFSLPTTSSQAPIAGSFTCQSSTANPGTTFTSSPPLSCDTSSSSGDTSSSSGEQSPTDSSSQNQSATSTQSQSATSTQSQASISNPTSTSAQLLTSSQPTTISQPVTVSENSAASQLALSGAPIASSLNESRALQASGGRHLETPGHIQTHPELIHVDSPKHPEYGSVDSRASTFRGTWPDNLDQTPRRMAEAGFFYTGVADFTRCYACGGGLRNWEAGDDPVIEHTRWYPTCPYVTKLKGEKYVQAVIVKQQQHLEEKRKQQVALSQQRAAQRNPPDPLRTNAAAVLSEMGYSQDRIKDAILAIRQQTGSLEVTAEQALIWILDDDERRSAIAARRAAGSAAFFSSSQTSTSVTTSTTSAATTSSSSGQVATGNQQPAETGIKQPSTNTVGNQQATETGIRHSASAGNLEPLASGSQQSGGTGSQPSSLEAGGNQQGATGGGDDETKKDEGSQSSGGKSRRKRRNKKGGQSASLPTEGASGNSGDLPPSSAEGATGNSGNLPPNTDTQSLRDENEKLRDIQTCKICLDKPVDTTFLPCGHLVCCGRCASKMRKCPICRKPIRGSVKTFMS